MQDEAPGVDGVSANASRLGRTSLSIVVAVRGLRQAGCLADGLCCGGGGTDPGRLKGGGGCVGGTFMAFQECIRNALVSSLGSHRFPGPAGFK